MLYEVTSVLANLAHIFPPSNFDLDWEEIILSLVQDTFGKGVSHVLLSRGRRITNTISSAFNSKLRQLSNFTLLPISLVHAYIFFYMVGSYFC